MGRNETPGVFFTESSADGELARAIRSKDWSGTALGPIDGWPRSLHRYLEMILELPTPAIIFWGPEQIQLYNDGYAVIMGPRHPTHLGSTFRVCWPEAYETIHPWMKRVLDRGETVEVNRTLVPLTRHGFDEECYFTFSFSPLRDDTRQIVGILQIVTEVTAAVLAERRTRVLGQLSSQTALARTPGDATTLAAEVLGKASADLPFALFYSVDGTNLTPVASTGPEPFSRDLTPELARAIRDRKPIEIDDLAERFGTTVATRALALPIPTADRESIAAVLVAALSPRLHFNDDYRSFLELVSAQLASLFAMARASDDEQTRARAMAELDRAKTEFFSNVSHEFRTPLTLMLGPLEDSLAELAIAGPSRLKSLVGFAHNNALRLLKLVNTLLDFSSIEAGRMRAHFAAIDLASHTTELAAMFHSAVEGTGLQLIIDCPQLSSQVWIDRSLWEKVVSNLVSNAFKFTFVGSITVRLRETTRHAVLEVADTGIGIAANELPKVFERFHRVPGTGRAFDGTGIGLSLVKDLVELHGGRIAVRSKVGSGTTFQVEIPKGVDHLPPDAVSHEPTPDQISNSIRAHAIEAKRWSASSTPIAPSNDRPTVLIVDDNADLRDYIAGLLSSRYNVVTAVDGMAALDAIRLHPPNLVVSDIMMPQLDGFGLVRALRTDPATAALPIILLSARAGEEAAVEGLDTGADDYLIKPFSARELLARVRTHIQLASVRRDWIAELETKNQELEAFAYSASHDLRAPLRRIDGFCRLLEEDLDTRLDDRVRGHLDRIRSASDRMSILIEDLLRLARVTRGELKRAPVDLTAIANEIAKQLRERDPGRTVELEIQPDLYADADPGLLRTALENLIANAWKFSARRSDAKIEIGVAERDGRPTYFVRDNGVGFPSDAADKVFRPFQRFHADKEFEGTGIGLATVQRIIARHGGRIWAEGIPENGATLLFQL